LESIESSKPDDVENLYIIDEQRCLEDKENEWEEEINQLKLQIENLETAHKEEILALVNKYTYKISSFEDPKNPGSFYSITDEIKEVQSVLIVAAVFLYQRRENKWNNPGHKL
jgi:hypothetical protein